MKGQSDFGSPIQTCKKCKGTYLDRRYHEIAIEGIGNTLSVKRSFKIALISLALFAAAFLLNLVMVILQDKYSVEMVFIQVLSLLMMLAAFIDAIMIKTGIKEKKLEKKRQESVKRLRNIEYARTLADFGYDVPEEYL